MKHFYLPGVQNRLRPLFMKFTIPAFCLLFLAGFGMARAQDEQRAPQDEIITDFGIDEYLAVPKFTLKIGVQTLSGAKATFTGRGSISSFQPPSDITTPNITRTYHDGTVLADNSPVTFTTKNVDGTDNVYLGPVTPDGYTNNWAYLSANSVRPDGNMDFHSYAVDMADPGTHNKKAPTSLGVDINLERDLGKITKNIEWKLVFGGSLNDIRSHTSDTISASVTTLTDTYLVNLNGHTLQAPPYSGPSQSTVPRVDENGVPVLDTSGSQYVDYVDSTVYLGNVPLSRTTTLITNGFVTDNWAVKGAYFTFRAGPAFNFRITEHLHADLGFGLALMYAGTQYTVEEIYVPDTADPLTTTAQNDESKLLVGYYVNATLQYDFTDKAGFYAGAVYQTGASYTQTATLDDTATGSTASYKALVDLSALQGFRMGMTFKF